jgi:hypothetical protein
MIIENLPRKGMLANAGDWGSSGKGGEVAEGGLGGGRRTADPSASLRDDKKERVVVGRRLLLKDRTV